MANQRLVPLARSDERMVERRRTIVKVIMMVVPLAACQSIAPLRIEQTPMYGIIGKMKTKPGQRDALAAILIAGTKDMPGCLSYIVATDPKDADALWITEAWENAESHKASLGLASVKAAITEGRPLILEFGERFETNPIGGAGLR